MGAPVYEGNNVIGTAFKPGTKRPSTVAGRSGKWEGDFFRYDESFESKQPGPNDPPLQQRLYAQSKSYSGMPPGKGGPGITKANTVGTTQVSQKTQEKATSPAGVSPSRKNQLRRRVSSTGTGSSLAGTGTVLGRSG